MCFPLVSWRWVKGGVCDSEERLFIFELNAQTNTPLQIYLPSCFHCFSLYTSMAFPVWCTSTNSPCCWLAGIVPLCLFSINRIRAVYEHRIFFFSAHTAQWGDIRWIWQKMYWIRIADSTFKALPFFLKSLKSGSSAFYFLRRCQWKVMRSQTSTMFWINSLTLAPLHSFKILYWHFRNTVSDQIKGVNTVKSINGTQIMQESGVIWYVKQKFSLSVSHRYLNYYQGAL